MATLVGVTALIAALEYQRVFGWNAGLLRLSGAVLIPTVLAIWAQKAPKAGWSLPASGLLSILLLVGYAIVTAGGPATVAGSLISGWSRILTTTLPVTGNPELLAFPIVLTWLCCLAGTELAMRARLPQAGFIYPTALLASAVFFGSRNEGSSLLPAGVFAFLVLAGFLVSQGVRQEPVLGEKAGLSQMTPVGVMVAAVCAFAAMILAPSLPLADANDPYEPTVELIDAQSLATVNPLAMLAGWAQDPTPVLFRVSSPKSALWRMAVLDRYDPEIGWYSDPDLKYFGGVLVEPESAPAAVQQIEYEVEIVDLSGIWIPAADRPISATGDGLLVDPAIGELAQPRGLKSGNRYRITSAVPPESPECALGSSPVGSSLVDAYPEKLVDLAKGIVKDKPTPCDQATAIDAYLRQGKFRFDNEAPSGNSGWRIVEFLGENAETRGRGTSEQFASSFALLANAAGMPARVAVGFREGILEGSIWTVTAGEAFAYVEIQSADGVWQAFDPTPAASGASLPRAQAIVQPVENPISEPVPEPTATGNIGAEAPATVESESSTERSLLDWVRFAAAGIVPFVAALAGAVWLTRRQRAKAISRGTAKMRTIAAWRQAIDALRSSGVKIAPSATVQECVIACKKAVGIRPAKMLQPLGILANGALFAGEQAPEESTRDAVRLAGEFQRSLAAQRTFKAKVKYALDARVLVSSWMHPRKEKPRPPIRSPGPRRPHKR